MRVQENARRQAEQDEPGEDGRPKKRGRGRPLGSKTKPRPEDELGPADTVQVSGLDRPCIPGWYTGRGYIGLRSKHLPVRVSVHSDLICSGQACRSHATASWLCARQDNATKHTAQHVGSSDINPRPLET